MLTSTGYSGLGVIILCSQGFFVRLSLVTVTAYSLQVAGAVVAALRLRRYMVYLCCPCDKAIAPTGATQALISP